MKDKEIGNYFCYCCLEYVDKISKYILSTQKLLSGEIYDGIVTICFNCKEKDYFIKNKHLTKIESFNTRKELDIFYKKYSLLK